jgi:hypothetical protein
MPSSYQVVLWKQESFVVLRLRQIEFFRNLLEIPLASSRWHSIPAKVARCIGTQYGFQFTALSTGQRENIRFAVRDHRETGVYDRATDAKFRERQREGEEKLSAQEQATQRAADTAFADRARMLIKRGYTPKVAWSLFFMKWSSNRQ